MIVVASRTFIIPLPSFVTNQSFISSAGSPKNTSPPLSPRATRPLIMALTLWGAIFPYSAL